MTLTQLRYVMAVSRYGSFSEAAKQLFVSQPTISTMIRDLEDELQIEIFLREKRGISLTPDGRRLLVYISEMLEQETAIREAFVHEERTRTDSFTVSTQHFPLVSAVFCQLVQERQASHYEYHLKETTTTTILNDVTNHISEIGVLAINRYNEKPLQRILDSEGLLFHPIVTVPAKAFLSARHPLAGRASVTIRDLKDYPCFYYDQEDDVLPYFAEEVRPPEHKPKKVIYINNQLSALSLMRNLLAYNIGTGIAVDSAELNRDKLIAVVPVEGLPPITVGWLSLAKPISPAGARFVSLLTDYFTDPDKAAAR